MDTEELVSSVEKGTSRSSKPKKKKWIVIFVFFIIAVLVVGGYFGVNLILAESAMHSQEFIKSKQYYDNLLIGKKFYEEEYQYVEAGVLMEEGKYVDALNAFAQIKEMPVPVSIIDKLKSNIYSDAQEAYWNGKLDDAKNLFTAINGYEHSNDYLLLIVCKNDPLESLGEARIKYSQLINIIDFEDTKDVILKNENTACLFLAGNWRSGSYGFDMGENASRTITYNLPCKDAGESYSINNGVLSFGNIEEF